MTIESIEQMEKRLEREHEGTFKALAKTPLDRAILLTTLISACLSGQVSALNSELHRK